MAKQFWSDGFDMDLPSVIPNLAEILGTAASIPMWTHGGSSYGKLNHPAIWHSHHHGMIAFFGLTLGHTGKPEHYSAGQPIVACTWLEALRDAWPHQYTIYVDNTVVWDSDALYPEFSALMYDLRGWKPLPDGHADLMRTKVANSIAKATTILTGLHRRRITEGTLVYVPVRLMPDHPGYESAQHLYRQPGPIVSIDDTGWAMVDLSLGHFGCHVHELVPA